MICPYAKDIGNDHIRGCSVKPNKMGTEKGGITTYYMPCTETCYNGDYTQCPYYKEAKPPQIKNV